jgi:hypothetical protein
MSSEFGRLMTSGAGSSRVQSISLSNSFFSTPRSPSSIDTVSSPSRRGSVESERLAKALMTHGASHRRSRNRGVLRKNDMYCWR